MRLLYPETDYAVTKNSLLHELMICDLGGDSAKMDPLIFAYFEHFNVQIKL